MKFSLGKGPKTGKMTKQISLMMIWKRPEQNSDSRNGIIFLTGRIQYLGVNCQS